MGSGHRHDAVYSARSSAIKRGARGLAFAALLFAVSPLAAGPVVLVPGATIYDSLGEVVGTIRSVGNDEAVVWTGSVKVTLGLSSFHEGPKGPYISMNRAQLEAAATRVQNAGDAEVQALLVPGAAVYDRDGAVAANVDSVGPDGIVLVVGTTKVRLPLSAFSKGAQGPRLATTAAELAAAVAAQSPPAYATPSAGSAPPPKN